METRPLAASFGIGEILRVVDGMSSKLLLVDASGSRSLQRKSVGSRERLDLAAIDGDNVVWGLIDKPARVVKLYSSSRRGPPRIVGNLPIVLGADLEHPYVLAVSGELIIASETTPPFRTTILKTNSPAITRRRILSDTVLEVMGRAGGAGALWRSLVPVVLDSAIVITLTDLTSNARILLRLSPSGEPQQAVLLNSPFGVVNAERKNSVLVGLRQAGGRELVLYRWNWQWER